MNLEFSKTLGFFRTQKFLSDIHDYIRWEQIERILLDVFPVGKAAIGNSVLSSRDAAKGFIAR
jgi:hypothetical protein